MYLFHSLVHSLTAFRWASDGPLIARPRDVRLVQRDHDSGQSTGALAERARVDAFGDEVGDHPGQRLGRRIHPGECRFVVEVSQIELAEYGVELPGCP